MTGTGRLRRQVYAWVSDVQPKRVIRDSLVVRLNHWGRDVNDADIDRKNVPFFGTVGTSADASAFSMLFGVRYYFDAQRR